jgi:DNA-binding beta-propeller fold protein YncE
MWKKSERKVSLLACMILLFFLVPTIAFAQSETYEFVRKWGSPGTGNGQFNFPIGIDVNSNGDVYVVEHQGNRVQKFDANGNFITKWGSYGKGFSQFRFPYDIAIDSNDRVYVADGWNFSVKRFSSYGNYEKSWGAYYWPWYSWFRPYWFFPWRLDVGANNVYIVDHRWNPKRGIVKFSQSAGYYFYENSSYTRWNLDYLPFGIAVDSVGNIYLADKIGQKIRKYDANGNPITGWSVAYPQAVAIDSQDNVYVASFVTGLAYITKFDANGNFITKWGSYGSGDGEFKYVPSLAVNADGLVYVVDSWNSRIQVFAPQLTIEDVIEELRDLTIDLPESQAASAEAAIASLIRAQEAIAGGKTNVAENQINAAQNQLNALLNKLKARGGDQSLIDQIQEYIDALEEIKTQL